MDIQDFAYNAVRLANNGVYKGSPPARPANRFAGGESVTELAHLAQTLAVQQARLDGYAGTDEEIAAVVAEREQLTHEQFLAVSAENARLDPHPGKAEV
jgi:hypothetical protein